MSNMKLIHTFITKNLLFLVPEAEVWYEHLPENDLKHCFHICPNQEKYVTAWKAQSQPVFRLISDGDPDDFRRMFDSYHTGSSESLQEALDFHHGTLSKHVADVNQTQNMNELKGRDLDMAIAKEIFGFLPREEELIPFHSDLNRALALCKKIGLGLRASELPVTPEEISWRCLEHWRLVGVLSDDVFGDKDTWAEPSELVFDSFRGSGQKTNQCESGVKATHIPTGLSAEFDGHRSYLQNREEALRLLKEKVQENITLMFLSCGVVVDQETVSWDKWVEYRKQVEEWNKNKPPIGVEPQSYWEENYPEPTNKQIIERMQALNGAIFRYYGAGWSPLREWIEEFSSLSSKIK